MFARLNRPDRAAHSLAGVERIYGLLVTPGKVGICWASTQRENDKAEGSSAPFPFDRTEERFQEKNTDIRTSQIDDREGNDYRGIVRPYSASLPSPGFEWCQRCNIPDKRYQKRIGSNNECLDRPRLFGFGICHEAKRYYRQQAYLLTCAGIMCFGGGVFLA